MQGLKATLRHRASDEDDEDSADEFDLEEDENVDAYLINPFLGKTQEEMDVLIMSFLDKTQMPIELHADFKKGAFLAQDRHAFKRSRNDSLSLGADEVAALKQEQRQKWNHPRTLWALVMCCSVGAAVQGMDEAAVNAAQLYYRKAFHAESPEHTWEIGLTNAAPYLCCAFLGCWLAWPLNHFLGRRGVIFLTCLISSISCVAQAVSTSRNGLIAARLVLGLGIGPKSATIPVYAAECSPANIRGAIVMLWQMFTAFGIMLGYICGVAFQNVSHELNNPSEQGDEDYKYCPELTGCIHFHIPTITDIPLKTNNWRYMLASPMFLPLCVAACIYLLPESPRWLVRKARNGSTGNPNYKKAFDAIRGLRHTNLQAARDLIQIHYLLDGEDRIKQHRNRFSELISVDRNRRALVASIILIFFQQFCGINALVYYSSLAFSQATPTVLPNSQAIPKIFTDKQALLGGMGVGIINFVCAIPALFLIDRLGRRLLLLSTFPFMALFQAITAIAYAAVKDSETKLGLILTGSYLFCLAYSPGAGPVPFVYAAESQALYVRDLGMSIVTSINWFFNSLLGVTWPKFSETFTVAGSFAWYSAWCIVGWVLILLFVPETKNLTLEQLNARFSIPTFEHADFAIKRALYNVRRYVFRTRDLPRPRLGYRARATVRLRDLPIRKIGLAYREDLA